MKKSLLFMLSVFLFSVFFLATKSVHAAASITTLHIIPAQILEGDPVMITLTGVSTTTNIKSIAITGPAGEQTALHFFLYAKHPTAFYGIGINQKIGTSTVTVIFKNGSKVSSIFTILTRTRPEESVPVPAGLGGNSTTNQARIVSVLDKENKELAAVYSNKARAFWTMPFAYPVATPITVTDPYGYNRALTAGAIIHKGTDFKAPPGTPVYAINRGVVRLTKTFTIYGDTVIVDHGLGIQSFYMHLSKMLVASGSTVEKGQLVGLSGETGYSEGPHLHLTVRIDGVSIDPMKFFALFGW